MNLERILESVLRESDIYNPVEGDFQASGGLVKETAKEFVRKCQEWGMTPNEVINVICDADLNWFESSEPI